MLTISCLSWSGVRGEGVWKDSGGAFLRVGRLLGCCRPLGGRYRHGCRAWLPFLSCLTGSYAVEEFPIAGLGLAYAPVDAFGDFALDAFPGHGFGVACLGIADLGLPFALDLVHVAFFFAFFRFAEGKGRGSVDEEVCRYLLVGDFGEAGLGEGDEVEDEAVRVAGVVDGRADVFPAVEIGTLALWRRGEVECCVCRLSGIVG